MKSNINFRLNSVFILSVITFVLIILLTISIINNYYISNKLDDGEEFLKTADNLVDVNDYFIENGFTVVFEDNSRLNILENYEIVNDIETEGIVIDYEREEFGFTIFVNDMIMYVYINENIVDDIIKILLIFSLVITILFIFVIYGIKKFVQIEIINKIYKIQDHIQKMSRFESKEGDLKFKRNDELNELLLEVDKYQSKIDSNLNEKEILVKSFTHELKNPLTKISAIMYLYENQIEPYTKYEIMKEEVDQEILEANDLIRDVIVVFGNNKKKRKINIKLNDIIDNYLEENQSIILKNNLSINIKEISGFNLNLPIEEATFIINNLLVNALKYSKEYSNINILINSKRIIIENTISSNQEGIGTSFGNEIVDFSVKRANLQVKRYEDERNYVVVLTRKKRKES